MLYLVNYLWPKNHLKYIIVCCFWHCFHLRHEYDKQRLFNGLTLNMKFISRVRQDSWYFWLLSPTCFERREILLRSFSDWLVSFFVISNTMPHTSFFLYVLLHVCYEMYVFSNKVYIILIHCTPTSEKQQTRIFP